MGIKEEIFDEFFSALEKEGKAPGTVVAGLRQLIENGEGLTEGRILELVAKGCEDGRKDKKS
jgi:hypothetical protein